MVEQFAVPCSKTSRTLVRGGIVRDKQELVVACGYSVSGRYGYFICWENTTDDAVCYSNPVFFKPKESEQTYREVLKQLEHLVQSYRNLEEL